ncbi:MAG: glycosyltransferase family 4 protein [Gemmatimonadaceae bacterium]
MRIVAVQTGLSPNSVLGGTITDREFLTRVADQGVEVHILVEDDGQPVIAHSNFVVHRWRRRLRKRWPYMGNADVALDLRRLLRTIGPVDWIRFNSPYAVGIGVAMGRCGHRVWGSYLHMEDRPVWNFVDRRLPAHCDLITCLSEDTRRDLVSRCPRADHDGNIVVPMGIDGSRFEHTGGRAELRASLGVGDDEVLLLFVGTLIPRKGIADLVAAWRALGSDAKARLLLIAKPIDAADEERVHALAACDSRVMHLPGVPYEQIPSYFGAADVFFFPSHHEGYGIVVGEAMAAGLPVITTRAQGIREVIAENETALASDVGDVNGHVGNLKRVVNDAALRRQLGEAGRRRIALRFGWDGIMRRLMGALAAPRMVVRP